jgi:outer membrane protein OmpA-like peptidoglycan-associated protein
MAETTHSDQSRRFPVWAPWAAGVVGGAAIVAGQLGPIRGSIEASLAARSQAALADAGYTDLHVTFTGRDGVVSNLSPFDDAAEIASIVREVVGVRVVDVPMVSQDPSTPTEPTTQSSTSAVPSASPAAPPSATPQPSVDAAQTRSALDAAGPVRFASDDAGIGSAQARVDQLAAIVLSGPPDARYEVRGYTDSVGDADANLHLSDERAAAVVEALVAAGVPEQQLSAVGFGETSPLVQPELTDDDKQANRRVEVVLVD